MYTIMRWIKKNKAASLPKKTGVYAFRDAENHILYIGKASHIRNRVKNHFEHPAFRDTLFINRVASIGYILTSSEIEALLLESRLIKKYQPKYNVMWRDDKKYFYVAITRGGLPRIAITHQPVFLSSKPPITNSKFKIQNSKFQADYVGPFVDGRALKKTLRLLRRIFPYYTQKKHPPLLCSWCHLGLCPGPRPDPQEYKKNIGNIVQILKGKKSSLIKTLHKNLRKEAHNQEFEKAAEIRDQISALENIFSHARVLSWEPQINSEAKTDWGKIQKLLQKILGIKKQISHMEAYDVSNIQGQEATGSMVTFMNGKPEKKFYRKFKVKVSGKPNDAAMIQEILSRRLLHKEWEMPQIILIDGGIGQLNAALAAKKKGGDKRGETGKEIKIIALAKKKNALYRERKKSPLFLKNLPAEVSNFLIYMSDEAHRFARAYHHTLRSQILYGKTKP